MSPDQTRANLLNELTDNPKLSLSRLRCTSLMLGKSAVSISLTILTYVACMFPRSLRPASNKMPHELHSTAYLDALRGYAAWIVFNSHAIHEGWRPESSSIMKFSFIRVWFRGHAMVDVFFVVSGYALSYRVLSFSHAKQYGKVMNSLASSTMRRYLRLFVPTAVATFACMIALTSGLAVKEEEPKVLQSTWPENLQFWVADTVRASSPFAHVVGWWYGGCAGSKYLPQMWTIPVEFRGSVVLFMFLAATSKMVTRTRLYVTCVCAVMCFWWEAQYAGEFLIGMWMADLRLTRSRRELLPTASHLPQSPIMLVSPISPVSEEPLVEKQRSPRKSSIWRTMTSPAHKKWTSQIPYIVLFFCSFTPLTAPFLINKGHEFPFNLIATLMPPNYDPGAQVHYPLAIGSVMLVYAVDHSPLLQKPFLLPISQFVGELSFGIYAMHNTVRWIVWERLFVKWQEAYWGVDAHGFWNLLPGYLVLAVLVVWAAEFFRRIDMKVVAWGKQLQDLCFEQD